MDHIVHLSGDNVGWKINAVLLEHGFDVPRLQHGIMPHTYLKDFNEPLDFIHVDDVTNFDNIFVRARLFNQDLSHWQVNQGTSFRNMFKMAIGFNQDISTWEINPNIHFNAFVNMFSYCLMFDQNLANWQFRQIFDNTLDEYPDALETISSQYEIYPKLSSDTTDEELDTLFRKCMAKIFNNTKMYIDWQTEREDTKMQTNYGQTLIGAVSGSYIGGKKQRRKSKKRKRRKSKRRKSKSKSKRRKSKQKKINKNTL